jgi:hypothetical protein
MKTPDFYDDSDQFTQRRRRRLREDLDLDEESVEIILRLRSQLVTMQKLVVELQAELAVRRSEHGRRFVEVRRSSSEALWRDTTYLQAEEEG